jgi:tRNA1Val (adenine37-N6)-methyltransferase
VHEKEVFQFKKFSVRHDRCTMKVGTDAVLLAAWVNVKDATYLLDIGTGSGVIALMLAQRTTPAVTIDAVEISEQDARQADENRQASPWPNKIRIHHQSIQQFNSPEKYDLIVTNPPFFIDSLKPPDAKRGAARHTVTLSHEDLINAVERLLLNDGKFNIILPAAEGARFIEKAIRGSLFCTRHYSFRSKKEKPVERWLMEFSRQLTACEHGEIILYDKSNEWSEDYRKITGDFYLSV